MKHFRKSHSITYSHCTVDIYGIKFLEFDFDADKTGENLFNDVCEKLGEIVEKDYFGLRIVKDDKDDGWLVGYKSVVKQLKHAKTNSLKFRFKHYPIDPFSDLQQKLSQYYLFKQLRADLFNQYIIVKNETLDKLIAIAILAENDESTLPTDAESFLPIVENFKLIPNISLDIMEKVIKELENYEKCDREELENEFVRILSDLETYGIEPFKVSDQKAEKMFIALNHQGICLFSEDKRTSIYYWENIQKMQCRSRDFVFTVNVDNKTKRLCYKFKTSEAAAIFWQWAMDRQNFFTLNHASEAKVVRSSYRLFSKKFKHKFTGMTQKELNASCQTLDNIPQPSVVRLRSTHSDLNRSNSSKAICRNSLNVDNHEKDDGTYATLPRKYKINFITKKESDTENANYDSDVDAINESMIEPVVESSVSVENKPATFTETSESDREKQASDGDKCNIEMKKEDLKEDPDKCIEELDVICEQLTEDELDEKLDSFLEWNQVEKQNEKKEICIERILDSFVIDELKDIPNGAAGGISKITPTKVENSNLRKLQTQPSFDIPSISPDDDDNTYSDNQLTHRSMPVNNSSPSRPKQNGTVSDSSVRLNNGAPVLPNGHYYPNSPTYDNMFLVKFVVLTTLLLLFVMITSLVIYYYYRSATIADLNKQKYESDLKRNVDFDSIKRFVMRNEEP